MKKVGQQNKFRNITVLLALLISLPSIAQEEFGDASAYKLQRRYRAEDKTPFKSYSFIDNCFAGLSLGKTFHFRQEYADGMDFALVFGKWFNAYHGLRLEPGCGIGKENLDGYKVFNANLYASYLFNLTHYMSGYDAYRFFDMSTVIGLGTALYSYNGMKGTSWSAHLGFNFNFHIHRHLSLFVEPLYDIASDPGISTRDVNRNKAVSALKTSVGICYNFQNKNFESKKAAGKVFVFGSAGAIVHNNLINKNGTFFSGVGMSVNIGAGVKCKPWLGFRGALHLSNCLWDPCSTVGLRANTYGGLRADAVFDVLPMFNSRLAESRFGFAFFLGPEFGYMRKTDGDAIISAVYAGASWGLQLKAGITSHFILILEPRGSFVPYSAPTDAPPPHLYYERNYYDLLTSLSLGLQYNF